MSIRHMAYAAVAAALSVSPAASADTEVAIDGGRASLHGSLRVPPSFQGGPAVLMIAGSGPTDRNGDSSMPQVKPANLRLLAGGLEREAIPSLRFDKRGIGASAPAAANEADLRFDQYVEDAVAWTRFLGAQPGVTCVVVFGHSEGALIGAAVAARTPVCGLIEASGAGRPGDEVIEAQFAASGASPDIQAQVHKTLEALKRGQMVETPPGLAALFRSSVQPYLISWLSYDPTSTLKAAKAPVLILQGDNDVQVSVADAQLLAAARPDAKLVIVPGMNHILKDAPTDRTGNIATYADPTRPLSSQVVPTIKRFIESISKTP